MTTIICPQCRKRMSKVDVYSPRWWQNDSRTEYVCNNPKCPVDTVDVERRNLSVADD